tara:strand:- start:117 stop:590 length:474 start_codon:yes stop_codon:yes gene_type:complete
VKTLFFILSFILIVSVVTDAKAKNEYLGSSRSSCERGSIEFYTELRNSDGQSMTDYNTSTNNDYKNYNDNINGTVGFRFRFPLQSTCNNKTIQLLKQNDRLRQELEMLSNCAKLKELQLGEEFATVREMCKSVNKVKKTKIEKKTKKLKKQIINKND